MAGSAIGYNARETEGKREREKRRRKREKERDAEDKSQGEERSRDEHEMGEERKREKERGKGREPREKRDEKEERGRLRAFRGLDVRRRRSSLSRALLLNKNKPPRVSLPVVPLPPPLEDPKRIKR